MTTPPKPETTASAEPAAAPQDATETPQGAQRTYSGPEVGEIVRRRVERQSEAHAKNLSAVAERAAVAAIERVRAVHDAEIGELLGDLDLTPGDLVALRRARRARELRKTPPENRHPRSWDASDIESLKREGKFRHAVQAWKGK